MELEQKQEEKQSIWIKIKKFIKKRKKLIRWIIILCLLVGVFLYYKKQVEKQMELLIPEVKTTTLETRNLEKVLVGSGVIQPQDQYTVVPLVQGEVLSAPFEEGQQVKKGDLLYSIDTKNVENSIKTAKLSVEQAENSYNEAVKSREQLVLKSNITGYVKTLKVKKGDMVSAGTPVADIYDNTVMYLTVPFNANDVNNSWVGKGAKVYVGENEEMLSGTVKEVSPTTESLSGGRIVKQVKIAVRNNGGLSVGLTGYAKVGSIECNDEGTFAVKEEGVLLASGTGEIENLSLTEGQKVSEGEIYATLKGDTVESQIKNAKTSLETAKLNLDTQRESLDNYRITAPISGQVITKTVKQGDTISTTTQGTGENAGLAVIYDLSSLKFEMKVDELDIHMIKVGQKVMVTCEALPGEEMYGKVENISLKSVNQNGITQYPVRVRMDENYKLLPGMNVDSKIVVSRVKNTDSLPLECLQRGNVVYIKDKNYVPDKKKKSMSELAAAINGQAGIPDGFKETTVEIGIDDGNYVQIKSGLQKDDEVYIPEAKETTSPIDYTEGGEGGE